MKKKVVLVFEEDDNNSNNKVIEYNRCTVSGTDINILYNNTTKIIIPFHQDKIIDYLENNNLI